MKRVLNFFFILVLLGLVSFSTLLSVPAYGETSDMTIISRTAEVDG